MSFIEFVLPYSAADFVKVPSVLKVLSAAQLPSPQAPSAALKVPLPL